MKTEVTIKLEGELRELKPGDICILNEEIYMLCMRPATEPATEPSYALMSIDTGRVHNWYKSIDSAIGMAKPFYGTVTITCER